MSIGKSGVLLSLITSYLISREGMRILGIWLVRVKHSAARKPVSGNTNSISLKFKDSQKLKISGLMMSRKTKLSTLLQDGSQKQALRSLITRLSILRPNYWIHNSKT